MRPVPDAFKKVGAKSLPVFSRQFATLVEAGVSIVSALAIFEDLPMTVPGTCYRGGPNRRRVGSIRSHALARHPRVFNRLFVAVVGAVEASGTLDRVLEPNYPTDREGKGDKAARQQCDGLPDRCPRVRFARA
jgi:type IV pilus assembly protein PilC